MYKLVEEREHFIIISKYPGIEFHTDAGLVQLLRLKWPQILGVHRLDKETSGLMIFAKNKETQSVISDLFAKHKVNKKYFAFSLSKPTKKQGTIKGDLEKTRGGSYKITRNLTNPSITKFRTSYFEQLQIRLFDLSPLTGKTHQLRVVLKSLGSPILGDNRYKGIECDRMYLHSYHIEFEFNGEKYKYQNIESSGELFENAQLTKYLQEFLSENENKKKGT